MASTANTTPSREDDINEVFQALASEHPTRKAVCVAFTDLDCWGVGMSPGLAAENLFGRFYSADEVASTKSAFNDYEVYVAILPTRVDRISPEGGGIVFTLDGSDVRADGFVIW